MNVKRFVTLLWAPVTLFLIVVLFYWRFTLSGQYEYFWTDDLSNQVLPWLTVGARQWSAGVFPLWDPHMWGGQPLLAQAQPGIAYFPNWILFSMPQKNGALSSDTLHWYIAIIHYMAAIFCFLLCRSLGRSRPASMLAGLIFSLMSFVGTTAWPQMTNGAVWIPLVFLFLLRAVRINRPLSSAALSGFFLGVSWLSGHHQVPLFCSLAAAGVWLFYTFRNRNFNRHIALLSCVSFLICGLVGALQIIPAREYGQQAMRWVSAPSAVGWNDKVPYSVHEMFSMPPSSFFGIVLPGLAAVAEPFVGFTAFTLAIVAIACFWRREQIKLFSFLAIASLLYSFGGYVVFEGVAYVLIPMVEKARTPAAAICLFGFSISVLAAYGVEVLGWRIAREIVRVNIKVLALAGAFLTAALFVFTLAKIPYEQKLAVAAIVALLLAALFLAVSRRALRFRHVALLCGLLILLEASSVTIIGAEKRGTSNRIKAHHDIVGGRDMVAYFRKQAPAFRILTNNDELAGNWAAYHGLDALNGYLASLSANIATVGIHNRNVQALWGVKYSVGNSPGMPGDQEAFSSASGFKIFARADAFPRAWVVHRMIQFSDRLKINEAVGTDVNPFRTMAAMTTSPPTVETCSASEPVEYSRPRPDMVLMKAEMACKGLVVVSDTFFPGWSTEVDGTAADIYEVNGAMRGVVVDRGKHTITMRYRPGSFYLAIALTLSGAALTAGLVWYERRRERVMIA